MNGHNGHAITFKRIAKTLRRSWFKGTIWIAYLYGNLLLELWYLSGTPIRYAEGLPWGRCNWAIVATQGSSWYYLLYPRARLLVEKCCIWTEVTKLPFKCRHYKPQWCVKTSGIRDSWWPWGKTQSWKWLDSVGKMFAIDSQSEENVKKEHQNICKCKHYEGCTSNVH